MFYHSTHALDETNCFFMAVQLFNLNPFGGAEQKIQYCEPVVYRETYGSGGEILLHLADPQNARDSVCAIELKKVVKVRYIPDRLNFMEANRWKFINTTAVKAENNIICYDYFRKEE